MWVHFLFNSSLSGVLVLSSLFFSFFFYPVVWRVSCYFWRFKVFCACSVDVLCELFYMWIFFFFDVCGGEAEHHVLLFHRLDPSPILFKVC